MIKISPVAPVTVFHNSKIFYNPPQTEGFPWQTLQDNVSMSGDMIMNKLILTMLTHDTSNGNFHFIIHSNFYL